MTFPKQICHVISQSTRHRNHIHTHAQLRAAFHEQRIHIFKRDASSPTEHLHNIDVFACSTTWTSSNIHKQSFNTYSTSKHRHNKHHTHQHHRYLTTVYLKITMIIIIFTMNIIIVTIITIKITITITNTPSPSPKPSISR